MAGEKAYSLPSTAEHTQKQARSLVFRRLAIFTSLSYLLFILTRHAFLAAGFEGYEFKVRAINWLAGAIQVPTESYDNMDPVGVDPRWETFGKLHEYLATAFPLVHAKLSLQKVNTYGLLFEWTGSDTSLKPLLLAAHQGERIWGRGASDDKSGSIGCLSAIESLLERDFQPTRTVVLAYGFDEEASGRQGAQSLGKAMLEIYGENSIAFVVDEG
ncbi:hypothetical protein MPER_05067, partial [Moniliophthora perniciosa FA553]